MYRVLICGSRDYANATVIWQALEELTDHHGHMEIVHGDARGADTIGANCAKALGHEVRAFPADWKMYGKTAGPIRNKVMLGTNPDLVLAFRNAGASPGTDHMVRLANRAGVHVRIYNPSGLYRDLPSRSRA